MNQIAASRTETLTARRRRGLPARYVRKDARTLALRLAYGPQSNRTTEVTAGPADRVPAAEQERERARLQQALALTGYGRERCRRILAAFDRRQAPHGRAEPAG